MGTRTASHEIFADPVYAEIELALFHLRRVWAKPDIRRYLTAQVQGGRRLQLSNLLVIYAVARLSEDPSESVPAGGPLASMVDAVPDEHARRGEVTVGAVADWLEIDPSTASRLVGHAIDAGFVSRKPSSVDARRANLQLTEAGQRVKETTDQRRRNYLAQIMADWSEEERKTFAHLLRRFTDSAAQFPMDASRIHKIFEAAAQPEGGEE